MPLIALTGSNNAGKTSLARALAPHYVRLGFADPIRAAVAAAAGEPVERVFSHPIKDTPHPRLPGGTTPRTLAIRWADAARQDFGGRCWAIALAARAVQHGPNVVIDDLRFREEMEWVLENRGFVVSLGTPPEKLQSLDGIALFAPHCPAESEARQAWLVKTATQVLDLASRFPPPPWWLRVQEENQQP